MTRRLAMISGRPAFKEDVYRSRVVPFLNWRPWWSNLPQELGSKFVTQLRYCFGVARSASRSLWLLLSGAAFDPLITANIFSVQSFARAFAYWHDRGEFETQQMEAMRRQDHDGDRFPRDSTRKLELRKHDPSLVRQGAKNDIGKLAHLMRERWRQQQFQQFCEQKRREAVEVRLIAGATVYDEGVVAKARLLFRNATAEERDVMLGASFSQRHMTKSIAERHRRTRVHLHKCPWCNDSVIPDWQHVTWQCEGFQANRPARPESVWARRFGWPNDANETMNACKHRLAFLGEVRATVRARCGFWFPVSFLLLLQVCGALWSLRPPVHQHKLGMIYSNTAIFGK